MKGWTYKKVFINCGNIFVSWVPEVLSRVRRGASFRRQQADTCSAEGRRHERQRLDRNRKPRRVIYLSKAHYFCVV